MDGSFALDNGSNPLNLPFDQRGTPFARTSGAQTDIDAFERQAAADSAQIIPTTTCAQFAGGTASDLSSLNYSVKKGRINQVNQGVFFYWVEVTATGGNSFFIDQSIVSGQDIAMYFFSVGSYTFETIGVCGSLEGLSLILK